MDFSHHSLNQYSSIMFGELNVYSQFGTYLTWNIQIFYLYFMAQIFESLQQGFPLGVRDGSIGGAGISTENIFYMWLFNSSIQNVLQGVRAWKKTG